MLSRSHERAEIIHPLGETGGILVGVPDDRGEFELVDGNHSQSKVVYSMQPHED